MYVLLQPHSDIEVKPWDRWKTEFNYGWSFAMWAKLQWAMLTPLYSI